MLVVKSKNGVPVRLTDERWMHITKSHPEMATQRDRVLETIEDPEMIQTGDYGELLAIRFYESTPLTKKYLVVPYREVAPDDGFVVTAYYTRRPSSEREIRWKR